MSDKPSRVASHNVVNMKPRLAEYVANAGFLPWTQDVALLTRLPIDGEPVSGFGELEWEPVCLSLLGAVPDHPKVKSMGSKTWFDNYLTNMPDDVDEETLKKYARAYILCLLGLTLMSNLYGDQVALHYLPLLVDLDNARRYSWGSAVLAFQYSQLCKASNFKKSQIGGCALLLQFWSWERMRIGAPQPYFRQAPDLEDDIHPFLRPCWSYLHWAGPKHFQEVPRGAIVFFRDQLERMTADVSLICFNIVEWHHLIRVTRQFGWKQMIPPSPIAFTNEHHGLERKKRFDWRVHLHQYVAIWSSRYERLTNGDPGEDGEDNDIPSDEYVYWYSRITRRLILPKLEEENTQVYRPSAHELPSNAAEGFFSTADPRPIFHRIFHTVVEELRVLGELRLLNINPDIIQFENGDDDDMNLDDDHVTNLDSQTAGYARPSSSRAPPSPPFRPSTSQAPPSPPFQPSTSQAPPSPPAHGHQLRTQKLPKQSWLKRLRRQIFGKD
ncbi:hypothetical protein QQ045_022759 [Rhodiola kirilowii]